MMTRYLLAALAAAGSASALELDIPVQCELGKGCYIQSYADRDPGPDSTDFTCGALSYDGHKGTDFRVPTKTDLARGIKILAAAPGRVRALRDDQPDTGTALAVEGRECGNGLVIDHGDGWETQYCHLARFSLTVQAGQFVDAGTVLGKMGLSGQTEFPHLHLSVRKDGVSIDPFDARPISAGCALSDSVSLWSAEAAAVLTYRSGGIVDAGFSPGPVEMSNIRAGKVSAFADDSPAMVFWARYYGLSAGDRLSQRITDPTGAILAETDATMPRNRAEHMLFMGRKRPAAGWQQGRYVAIAVVTRDGTAINQMKQEIVIPAAN